MLDYMHARYCSPGMGRFFSADPVLGDSGLPQSWNRYAYVRNNPMRYVDPHGRESAQIYLDAQIDQFLETGTDPYFHNETLQKTALFALVLANPVPGDEAGVAAMIAPKAVAKASGILGRVGKFLGKLFGRADDVSRLPGGVSPQSVVTDLSKRSLSHTAKHLDEFRTLDPTMTASRIRELGASLVESKNLITRPGAARMAFEGIVDISGSPTRVRTVLNEAGKLRSVHIRSKGSGSP